MNQKSISVDPIRSRALTALHGAFSRQCPAAALDDKGYAGDFRDILLPMVSAEDFEADLNAGSGNELQTKFRAVHSSSALAVNAFAPFRQRIGELAVLGHSGFTALAFEQKCPTGLRRGTPPNLDVLVSGESGVMGIESKLTEYLTPHRAKFSPAYEEQIRDARREEGYFSEMQRLMDEPDRYTWLDAAQLIKHAFGLAHTFRDRPATLLYLFWEPADPSVASVFVDHRREIAAFAERVAGSTPVFKAMSYSELWTSWEGAGHQDWLGRHIAELRARYEVIL